MLGIGVIGYGYWGPNIVRNFQALPDARVIAICDKNPAALARAQGSNHNVQLVENPLDLIAIPGVDAVAVISPVWTHFELAKAALQQGKHVFVEKPFTRAAPEAEQLIEIAQKNKLTVMVDHTFLFTGAVRKIRQLIDEDILGTLYYYDSTRVNLGLFQHDVNVVWDLAPHDLSILDYLVQKRPEVVVATGAQHFNGLEDVAFITIYFSGSVIAHVNVNWLSPVKVRTTLIGGEKKMLLWNDLEADEKIKVYDKGVQVTGGQGLYDLLVSYRSGDMWAPKVEQGEALRTELAYFIHCVTGGEAPFNDGEAGLRVVKMLEAAETSLKGKGKAVSV